MIPLVAQDQRATKVAFGYIRDFLTNSPLLASMVEETLSLEVQLTNRVSVACFPCTQRSLRGWSIPAACLDEVGFFRLVGSADSDVEIQASIRREMLAFPETRMVKISTPYMNSGILYEDFKNHYGRDSEDVLVWRASNIFMNPTLKANRLDREKRLDPQRFAREYEAEFAEDLESFLPTAWVEDAVVTGRHELPPGENVHYEAGTDSSGGGKCAFTVSIVHAEGDGSERRIVQDVVKGWSSSRSNTIDLEGVVKEIADLLKRYRISKVTGDKYARGWVRQAFEKRNGISYLDAPEKSQAYLEVEPLFATGHIEILDHPQLIRELRLLERRPRPGGKVLGDHPHGSHDDYANALALAVGSAIQGTSLDLSNCFAFGPERETVGENVLWDI